MSTKNLARTAVPSGHDPDLAVPHVTRVGRSFHDELGLPELWLASQVGRPWHLVRGELVRMFDTRTASGRHIVFDHMSRSVNQDDDIFVADADGLLRRIHLRRPLRACHDSFAPRPNTERRS